VTFLAYSANPVKLQSQRIGTYVLLYLAFFFVFAYCSSANTGKTCTDHASIAVNLARPAR
jgi:hypothetical protein